MRRLVLLSTAILALTVPSSADTYVVNPDGTGDFPTIQAAIEAVVDGDVIELRDGTFTGDGNRDLDFLGKAITVRSQGGSADGCVIDCQGSAADPHQGFYINTTAEPGAVLADLTIRAGYAHYGGGAFCYGSSPTITGCIFADCEADIEGGGLSARSGSPTVTACVFAENWAASHGGGACCHGSDAIFTDCQFSANSSAYGGGAFGSLGGSEPVLTGCTFSANTAQALGGGVYCLGASPVLRECIFSGNVSQECGGGFYCRESSPTLGECTFHENVTALGGGEVLGGGGIFCWDSFPLLTNCTFYGNSSRAGGSLYLYAGSYATLENTIIAFSEQGEAIGGFYAQYAVIHCCDLYGNAGGDWTEWIEDQYGINGNICEDPLLCDPENGDFTLRDCSPCAPFSPPNPECDLIGAWPVGCGGSPTIDATWGGVKAIFRW